MADLIVVSNEDYTGMTSDEKNARWGLDGWPCECDPPHGVRLVKEGKFVRTRHFPGELMTYIMMPTTTPAIAAAIKAENRAARK